MRTRYLKPTIQPRRLMHTRIHTTPATIPSSASPLDAGITAIGNQYCQGTL
jgi:hypothetical protein